MPCSINRSLPTDRSWSAEQEGQADDSEDYENYEAGHDKDITFATFDAQGGHAEQASHKEADRDRDRESHAEPVNEPAIDDARDH